MSFEKTRFFIEPAGMWSDDVQSLFNLLISNRIKRFKVGNLEIEPDYSAIDKKAEDEAYAIKEAEALAAQEIKARLMDVTDEQLLDDPYAGLPEAFAEIDNRAKPDQSKEGLTDE